MKYNVSRRIAAEFVAVLENISTAGLHIDVALLHDVLLKINNPSPPGAIKPYNRLGFRLGNCYRQALSVWTFCVKAFHPCAFRANSWPSRVISAQPSSGFVT